MIEFIVGLIVALIGAFFYGKNQGKKEEVTHKINKSKEVEDEVNKMGDGELVDSASEWVRNKYH